MKKLILMLFCFPIIGLGQFKISEKNIKYTNFVNEERVKKYWQNSNEEIYQLEGIYKPYDSVYESVLKYILAIIKVDDYYEVIQIGKGYGKNDVNEGGVKATAKKMLSKNTYEIRWRMANATIIEKGIILKKKHEIIIKLEQYPNMDDLKFIKIFSPN